MYIYHGSYVSPERLNNDAFVKLLQKATVRLIAVDEAHCVYEWGNSFRPDYLRGSNALLRLDHDVGVCVVG